MENLPKITFEKLPDGTCVITVKNINAHGDTYIRQEIIQNLAVFEALKAAIEILEQHKNQNK